MKTKIFIGTVLTLIIPVLLASCARDLPELIDDGDGSANAIAITDPYLKCVSYSLGPGSFVLVTLVTPPVMNTTWT
ncbi:MAG: hypothetical protein LUF87_00210 [Alistipes sp.]|nr:hypothetical protein [Alistipes sp.]